MDLPSPVSLRPLLLNTYYIAPSQSFARSGALSARPADRGIVNQAQVEMSDGNLKNMLGDVRVTLSSSDTTCVQVETDLSSA